MNFKYTDYIHFLQELNKLGASKLFREDASTTACYLLRHDIDFSLRLAYEMAKMEHENGIKATYFILTTCERYNILSEKGREYLKKIIDLDHEIGLHFDPTLYGETNLEEAVKKEVELLSFATGIEIKSISLHNPSIHGQYPLFEGFVNAYDPTLFSDENYISDSCFSFRGKDPLKFIQKIAHQTIQILIHPLHFSKNGHGYKEIFAEEFCAEIFQHHLSYTEANMAYKEQLNGSFNELKSALEVAMSQKV